MWNKTSPSLVTCRMDARLGRSSGHLSQRCHWPAQQACLRGRVPATGEGGPQSECPSRSAWTPWWGGSFTAPRPAEREPHCCCLNELDLARCSMKSRYSDLVLVRVVQSGDTHWMSALCRGHKVVLALGQRKKVQPLGSSSSSGGGSL